MGSKEKEIKCIYNVIHSNQIRGSFSKQYHNMLKNSVILSEEFERPDFVLSIDNEIYGIEHCQTDLLIQEKKKRTHNLLDVQNTEINKTINKYNGNPDLLDVEIANGQALKKPLELVEERINLISDFNYENFISNFKKVCSVHNDKCSEYIEHINSVYKRNPKFLGCLVEIHYPKIRKYKIVDANGNSREQALKHPPITKDMMNVISSMKKYEFVIVFMHEIEIAGKKPNYYIFYVSPKDALKSISDQLILRVNSFELVSPFNIHCNAKVKISSDNVVYDGENIKFNCELKIE